MIEDALSDIREDFEELDFLWKGYKDSLEEYQKSLISLKEHPSYIFLKEESDRLHKEFMELRDQIIDQKLRTNEPSSKQIVQLSKEKRRIFYQLRTLLPLLGSLITSTDWQSPSFAHSLHSEAGIQEGKILANLNDYKRDRHLNEEDYQTAFMKEYVDGFKFPAGAYLTSSGMAALTTVITYLTLQKKVKGPVMTGKSIYFENAEMIDSFFSSQKVTKVDEMDTDKILDTYNRIQPNLIIFDSLCNAPTVAVADLPRIIKHISETAKKEIFLVIDNSTLSIALQPLKTIRIRSKLKLIVFESLNKYHQFGLDRITAGIVWYRGSGFENLYYARDHAGTNIADRSVYALPSPSRKHLEKRLARLNRNAHFLATSLDSFITKNHPRKIQGIVYPGLPSHPSYKWSSNYSFQGSYFVISFKKEYQKVRTYQRFVNSIIANARKKKVSINGGTSFGFNTTRVYLTAKNTDFGTPFIRVSLGTENRLEMEKLKDVFEHTLKSF